MKSYTPAFRAMTILIVMAATSIVNAADFTWTGASNVVWSVPQNWTNSGPPGASDLARFFDTGSVALGAGTTTANVTSNTTVRHLWFGQTNLQHNLVIDAGVTLTLAGNNDNGWGPLGSDPNHAAPPPALFNSTLYVGTKDFNVQAGVLTSNSISGPGTLVVSNLNNEINIRQANNGRASLNLSGLNTFVANLARIRVGDGEAAPLNRSSGTLFLAKTNTITLTGPTFMDNEQLVVGNNDVNSGNAGTALFLGQQNTLNVSEILIGGRKQTATMAFAPGLVNPTLTLRGSDGVSRVAELRVSDQADQSASGSATTGTLNLSGGTSDILADEVTLAKSQSSAGSAGTGTLTLGLGTFNVNTFDLAHQMANNITANMNATFNSTSNNITVNNLLRLGRSAGGTGARNSTLNITRGSLTVNGTVTTEGVATVRVTNAPVLLTAHPSILASVMVLDGATLSNAAIVKVTNSLTLVNSAQILGGNPVLDMGNSAATWNMAGILGGSLTVGNEFKGAGTFTGNMIQAPGATLNPSGSGPVGLYGTVTLTGNLTLNAGTLLYDLNTSALGSNDRITGSGTLTLNGTNNVVVTALGGSLDKVNPYALISSTALTGNATYFTLSGPVSLSRYSFAFDTSGNSVKLVVSGADPSNLNWVGDGLANVWDVQGTANWDNGAASTFFNLDKVTFGDSGSASPHVNLTGAAVPGLTTVNSSQNYAFGGSGSLSISGPLNKGGSGSLTISNANANAFNSLVTVTNGAVTAANSGANTFAGGLSILGGSVTLGGNSVNTFVNSSPGTNVITISSNTSLSVVNANANSFGGSQISLDGTLAFNQSVNADLDSPLVRFGSLTKAGSGTLSVLAANPNFGGPILITGGTLRSGVVTSLGTNAITVTNSGALDVSGNNLAGRPIFVSGAGPGGTGALVNKAAPTDAAGSGASAGSLTAVTLTGDATFGGVGKWNTDPVLNGGKFRIGALSTGGQPYNLTKYGSNEIILNGAILDSALANITVQQGLLTFLGGATAGDTVSTLTVSNGATVSFADSISVDKNFDLHGDGSTPTLLDYTGQNIIAGAMTLNGNVLVDAVDVSRGTPISITLNGAIGGTGGLTKAGLDSLTLAGINTYSGITTVSNGTLFINGDNQGTGAVTVQGGTLAGSGQVAGPVTVNANGILSPGNAALGIVPASLDLNNNNLTLNGNTNVFVLSPGSGLNTSIADINTLTVNGTSLVQVIVSGVTPLNVGDTYTLFTFSSGNATTNNLQLLPVVFYTFALTNTGTSIQLRVLTAAAQLTWNGTYGTLGVWDNNNTINWLKVSDSSHVVFTNGDFATFDDTGEQTVTISGSVVPSPSGFISFISTDVHPYTFQGSGSIDGTTGIRFVGNGFPSLLTIANNNSFSGPIILDNGALTIGSGGSAGSVGTAAIMATNVAGSFYHPTPVTINRSDNSLVINGNISGDVLVTNIGSGIVTLGGVNTFTGGLYVASGTIRIDNGASLGSTNNLTTVTNGATLDVGGLTNVANGINGAGRQVLVYGSGVNGRGAIVNNGTNQQQNALQQVILGGDIVFGGGSGNLTWTNTGNPGRWDIRTTVGATNAFLTTSNNPYSITKVGSNQVSLVNVQVDPFLGDINIRTGAMSFESISSLGDPSSNLTVSAGATMNLFTPTGGSNDFTKVFGLTGDGVVSTVRNQQGITTLRGSISLSGSPIFELLLASTTITNLGTLGGSGNLIKSGPGLLVLSGSGSHSGNTTIRDGTLMLKGSASVNSSPVVDLVAIASILDVTGAGGSLTRGSGQTIKGNGTLRGSLIVNSGGTNSPGASIGRLTVTNGVTLNAGSVTFMEVSASPATNDVLTVTGGLQYGGDLIVVTNGVGNLSAGQTFKLFNSSTTPTGSFGQIFLPNISPLSWSSNMAAGTITVVGLPGPTNPATILTVTRVGTNIVLHGTNHNVPNTSFKYVVLTSTNVATPVTNWTSLATNSFNGDGTFDFTNGINLSQPRLFYDTKAVP